MNRFNRFYSIEGNGEIYDVEECKEHKLRCVETVLKILPEVKEIPLNSVLEESILERYKF
jgi:hypothetical protein